MKALELFSRQSRRGVAVACGLVVLVAPGVLADPTTERASISSAGAQATGHNANVVATPDGRYVVFDSDAANLVADDSNGAWDVFLRDRQAGTTERVSVSSTGFPGNASSAVPDVSADGRFVVFESDASTFVANDSNGTSDVFLRDRLSGTTELISVATTGFSGNAASDEVKVSDDGRWVVFESDASDLVAGDLNGTADVFIRDRQTGTTTLVSIASDGTPSDEASGAPAVSADGRFVAFLSLATNFVAGNDDYVGDIYVRDRQAGTTELISVGVGGAPANGTSVAPTISNDGKRVAFWSAATDLVPSDTNGFPDYFVRDRAVGFTRLVSVAEDGTQQNGEGWYYCRISGDGGYVAFDTYADNLVAGDTNGRVDIFVHAIDAGRTELVSLTAAGELGNDDCEQPAVEVSPSDGSLVVAFASFSSNLVNGDTNVKKDAFVRLGVQLPNSLFADGFESGSASGWSYSVSK